MQLTTPIIITSRLMAGVRVGDAEISIGYSKQPGREGCTRFLYYIDAPDCEECYANDLQSGCQGGSLQGGLASLLSFLNACAESVGYAQRTGRKGENADLFPPDISAWAYQNSDEIGMLAMEIEESGELISERCGDKRHWATPRRAI
jgi:hypothetical protein